MCVRRMIRSEKRGHLFSTTLMRCVHALCLVVTDTRFSFFTSTRCGAKL